MDNIMFNNLDPKNKDIDDIFADTDNTQASAPVAPVAPITPRPVASPAIKNPVAGSLEEEGVSTKSKMAGVLKKMVIAIVVLILIGAAAYIIYAKFLINTVSDNSSSENNAPQTMVPVVEAPIVPLATTTLATSTEATSTLATSTVLDADSDGLSDLEESVLGTDPNKADTDGDTLTDGDEVKKYLTSPILKDTDADGLTDGEEVVTYKTNPNNPDTDGDTYKDGDEVAAHYDPLTKPVK